MPEMSRAPLNTVSSKVIQPCTDFFISSFPFTAERGFLIRLRSHTLVVRGLSIRRQTGILVLHCLHLYLLTTMIRGGRLERLKRLGPVGLLFVVVVIVDFLDIDTSKITFSKPKPNKYNGTQIRILYEGKTFFVKYEGITPFVLVENFDKHGNYQGTSMQINCEDEYLEKAKKLDQFFIDSSINGQ